MHTYFRLLNYIRPYRYKLLLAFVFTFFFSIFHSLASGVTYIMVNGFYSSETVVLDNLPKVPFLDQLAFPTDYIPWLVFVVVLTRGIFDYLSNYLIAGVGLDAITDIRRDLFKHLSWLSVDYYSRGRTGDLISRLMGDVQGVENGITAVVLDLVRQPFILLLNIPLVFFWGGKVAVLAVVSFPIVAVPIIYLGRKMRKTSTKVAQGNADVTSMLQEVFTGIYVIKSYTMEKRIIEHFERRIRKVLAFLKRGLRITIVQRPLVEVMAAGGIAVAVAYGYRYLEPDRFMAFIASLFILYEPVKKLSKVHVTIQHALACGDRIFEVLDAKATIQNKPDAQVLTETIREIVFNQVSFAYRAETIVLNNINLTAKQGEVIALVGVSGAGKTSLVNLIPRFHDVSAGSIFVNGVDLREYTIESLRSQVGLVMQGTVLFNDSVAYNISCGESDVLREDIERAAKAAHAHEFISRLPQGYDTHIGERGITLSGGQGQRLSIARAFFKNPPVLILDEATSQLDTESEREIQAALKKLLTGRMVFVIAHRLSTVQHADRIIVLDGGRIVQTGSNKALLAEGGIYRRLYELQFQT